MNILFVEPPAHRRTGGIDTALAGCAAGLARAGATVSRRESSDDAALAAADVVHFHGLWERSHRSVRRHCMAANKPYLVSPHGMLEPWAFRHKAWKKRPYFHLFERPALRGAAALLATSALEARGLEAWFPPELIRVLPLGIEPEAAPVYEEARRALGWVAGEPVVVFLSRLHEKKGLHLLIEAWAAIDAPGRLVIVGDGEPGYVDPLKARTASLPSVQWIGPRWGRDKWPYLQGADLFCLPSFSENFGFAVLEALLVGTPVLTTPATPWGELGAGLPVTLTEPAVGPLTAALTAFRRAPRQPEPRAAVHREVVARFAWSNLATRYLALYRELATRA